ncbi:hypothetical protein [Polaromonas sp. CG9_12]|uniref:hypothetical protein n=1 Tax=Polaromonas sp. CG_9.11 TaxID=2787730 RepID=UPI0004DDC6C3|nr:hypothetical protein [Polaromonas sp. CG_9.11]MBG6077925.1 hypothetical protein [Polaromonas sp. CG_9.11]CDS55209.1 hypothetical protein [Polaromonas sp. CG9_12]
MIALLQRILKGILFAPLAVFLLFEEWGWEPLAACFAALGRLPVWRQIERLIIRLPPWAALLAFCVPVLLLIPVKLLALFLLGKGHIGIGLGLVVSAKIAGTALAARLFQLTEPALMQMGWFSRAYPPWKAWKDRMLRQVRVSWPWRLGRRMKHMTKAARVRLWNAVRQTAPEEHK